MEASSEALNPEADAAPPEGETADGTEIVTADVPIETSTDAHEPIGAEDAHGSVTPSSAAPPEALSGEGVTPDPIEDPPNTMTGA